jgi:hypothetical protein
MPRVQIEPATPDRIRQVRSSHYKRTSAVTQDSGRCAVRRAHRREVVSDCTIRSGCCGRNWPRRDYPGFPSAYQVVVRCASNDTLLLSAEYAAGRVIAR